jgi:hypothetical protein
VRISSISLVTPFRFAYCCSSMSFVFLSMHASLPY